MLEILFDFRDLCIIWSDRYGFHGHDLHGEAYNPSGKEDADASGRGARSVCITGCAASVEMVKSQWAVGLSTSLPPRRAVSFHGRFRRQFALDQFDPWSLDRQSQANPQSCRWDWLARPFGRRSRGHDKHTNRQ